jgi:hypothetical protein
MTTKLNSPVRREVLIEGEPYVVTIAYDGLKLVPKGRRKGYELSWKSLVSGEAALAVALNASLEQGRRLEQRRKAAPAGKKRGKLSPQAREH